MLRPLGIKVSSLCIQTNSILYPRELDLGTSFGDLMYSSIYIWSSLDPFDHCGCESVWLCTKSNSLILQVFFRLWVQKLFKLKHNEKVPKLKTQCDVPTIYKIRHTTSLLEISKSIYYESVYYAYAYQ